MRTQTTRAAKASEVEHGWIVVDAEGVVVGRLASFIALRLRGKHRPDFTPNIDTGDHVVVINAAKAVFTGKKLDQKVYHRVPNTQPGSIKSVRAKVMHQTFPTRIIESAVKGMLPKGPLGRQMYRKLKVYEGANHQQSAQQPETMTIEA